MNDFFTPGPATGLPWESKPLLTAAASSCCCVVGAPDAPNAGKNDDGDGGAAPPGGGVAGPGGNSRSPLRPQPASASAAAATAKNPKLRRYRAKGPSPDATPDARAKRSITDHAAAATLCRQPLAREFTTPFTVPFS